MWSVIAIFVSVLLLLSWLGRRAKAKEQPEPEKSAPKESGPSEYLRGFGDAVKASALAVEIAMKEGERRGYVRALAEYEIRQARVAGEAAAQEHRPPMDFWRN